MKLVIEIPEEDYNNIEPFLNGETIKGGFNLFKALEIIKNGKPLPKGHGRLGDLDALQKEVSSLGMNDYEPSDFIDEINNADTIIEADKESEE